MKSFALARLKERSTWLGLLGVIAVFGGIHFAPEQKEAILYLAIAIFGGAVTIPDKPNYRGFPRWGFGALAYLGKNNHYPSGAFQQNGGFLQMTLGQKQELFALMLPDLLERANELNPVRIGDTFRDPRVFGQMGKQKGYGHKNSCHKLKLAVDINFVVDGVLGGEELHEKLHDWWDNQGGANRIPHDLNHYSLEHNGYR
jgi:hypothetical protein